MVNVSFHGPTIMILPILIIAVWYDVHQHRIPNALSLGGMILGIMLQIGISGSAGLLAGLGGTAVGIGIFLPFYLLHGMGAGDVKLMGAVGAFLGPYDALLATGLSLGAGGVMALVILLLRGGLSPLAKRYWATLKCLLLTHKLIHQPPAEGEIAAMKFPYAAAIGIGTLAAMWWLSALHPLFGFLLHSIR
jgi:prepilin peptidase CpaA